MATISGHPGALLVTVMAAQMMLWTLVPMLTYVTAPLDVMENIGWGRAWQLGYYAHPPLQAWLTAAAVTLAGGAVWPAYLLSQIAIVLTYIPLYLLGREAAGARAGLLAVLLFSLVYYANWPTPEFNANVVQMPIWALSALALWRATSTRRLVWWLALGFGAALAVYAKYSAVVLFAALILTSLAVPICRRAWRTLGPYVALGFALLLVLPHLVWLVHTGFPPIHYAVSRARHPEGLARLVVPLRFAGAQALDHLGAALMLAVGGAGHWRSAPRAGDVTFGGAPDLRRFVAWMAIAPYGLTLLFSLVSDFGLHDMWGAPMPIWISLAAVLYLRPVYRSARAPAMLAVWAVLFVGAPVALGAVTIFGVDLTAVPPRAAWPGPTISTKLEDAWRNTTGGAPLRIVAGDTWAAGIVTTYSRELPAVLTDEAFQLSPWITPADVERSGALLVWSKPPFDAVPASVARFAPLAAVGKVTVAYPRSSHAPAVIGWAIRAPGAGRLAETP